MPTINAPAQRVELRLDGEWLDITTAVRGFAQPTKRIEEETGRPLTDQLRLRLVVPLLERLKLTPTKLEQSGKLYLRLTLFDGHSVGSAKPPPPWFYGRVVELSRRTELVAGDLLDLTAHDLLDEAKETAPPLKLCTEELLRYDEVLRRLTAAAGLPLADHDGQGLPTKKPYLSHHPRPLDSSPENRVRALCWWEAKSLLLCGVFESVVAYDPARGEARLLANPPWETADPPQRQIERLWLDGERLHGVLLPTLAAPAEMEGKLFSVDLSGDTPEAGLTYEIQSRSFKLWSAGRAEVVARRYEWRDRLIDPEFYAAGYAVGTIGPDFDNLDYDRNHILFGVGVTCAMPPYWFIRLPEESAFSWKSTEVPWLMGRNLFLPAETWVTAKYAEDDPFRAAEVTAYRMPNSRGYFVPDSEGLPQDLGGIIPHGEKMGELPLTLPAGYYAFISHGRPRPEGEDTLERVAQFTLSFSRNSRLPAVAAPLSQGQLLSAEDIVSSRLASQPLGPLSIVMDGVDEFERLWFRDLATDRRELVSGFSDRAVGIQLVVADERTVYIAYSKLNELVGSYNRRQSRLSLTIGRAVRIAGNWQYSTLHELHDDSTDYTVTALEWDSSSRSLLLGVSGQSRPWHTPAGVRVRRVFTEWKNIDEHNLVPATGWVWLDGYFKDDFSVGDRVRLLPAAPEKLPYAPLSRTVRAVDWYGGRWTRLQISPAPDVSDGNLDPVQRQLFFVGDPAHSLGVEEFWTRFPQEFPDGAPTLQREAAVTTTEQRLYRYQPNSPSPLVLLDDSGEFLSETLTAKEDSSGNAAVELSQPFCQSESIRLVAGGREIEFTIDEARRRETGEFRLLVDHRYRGRELSASYRYHDGTQSFSAILATAGGIFYTRGAGLRSLSANSRHQPQSHGMVHHEATATASNLVSGGSLASKTIYGVAEGGGDLLYQLSTKHSLFVGGRDQWQERGITSCLVELALALGCRFWLDEGGRLRFLPRSQEGKLHKIAPEQLLDYQLSSGLGGAVTTQRVSWSGGEAVSGAASLHGITDEESLHCELLTSQGWAELLAESLHQQKNHNRRAELLLAGFDPSLRLGDTVVLPLGNREKHRGRIIELAPQLDLEQARTALVLEMENQPGQGASAPRELVLPSTFSTD